MNFLGPGCRPGQGEFEYGQLDDSGDGQNVSPETGREYQVNVFCRLP